MKRLSLTATIVVAMLAALQTVHAQAPKITPKGDPSVKDDSIYKLAVDPSERPNDALLYLLDDGVLRVEADGRHTRTYRWVVQILKEPQVKVWAEQTFAYAPDHENLTVNWVKVLKQNGDVISEKPATVQETESPASTISPVYVREKVRRMSLSGVAVGTIVDFSFTIEEKKPFHSADHFLSWTFAMSNGELRRNRLIYDVPASVQPTISERNMTFKPTVTEKDGRRTYVWAAKEMPKYASEPFAPDSSSGPPRIAVSLPMKWADVGGWYAGLAKDRYDITAAAETKFKSVILRARTKDDSIRAVHKWVTQEIRYVSLSLGMGGYQPRTPIDVVTTGIGDCKDKATLFIAALRKMNIEAHPVLLSSTAFADSAHPSINQFNHAIAAVRLADGKYMFTDLTAEYTKYGELPLSEQGGFAIVVLPDGKIEEVRLPRTTNSSRRIETTITGTLTEAGMISGSISEVRVGDGFEYVRNTYGAQMDSARKATAMRAAVSRFPGAKGDSLTAFDGRNLSALVAYTTYFSNGRGSAQAGDADLFTVPIAPLPITSMMTQIQSLGPRKAPIDAGRILVGTAVNQEMLITLPAGWKARLPKSFSANSDFGKYSVNYVQSGQQLRIQRTIESADGVFPASRMADVMGWLLAISADENNKTIILEHGTKQ